MLSLTNGAPKELLPVAGVPVITRVLEECEASGINEALIVTAPGKEALEEKIAPLAGRMRMPEQIQFCVQQEPRGLADAIRLGREFAGKDPLAVALPDNLFLEDEEEPALKQVIDQYSSSERNVVAVVRISAKDAVNRGPTAIYPGELVGDEYRISEVPGKGEKTETFNTGGAESAYTAVGRFVFDPEVFSVIDEVEKHLAQGAELDDVPVMQALLARGKLTGRLIRGKFFDVGLMQGLKEADAEFAKS
jgi:UTP--glucose-1-phosphate uridylyltransferase